MDYVIPAGIIIKYGDHVHQVYFDVDAVDWDLNVV